MSNTNISTIAGLTRAGTLGGFEGVLKRIFPSIKLTRSSPHPCLMQADCIVVLVRARYILWHSFEFKFMWFLATDSTAV